MNTSPESSLPSAAELLLETSLYVNTPVSENDKDAMEALRNGKLKLDAYCVGCQRESIFKSFAYPNVGGGALGSRGSTQPPPNWMKAGSFSSVIVCQRCSKYYNYEFRLSAAGLMKIGQYPSMEDILSHDLQPYKKLLRPEDFAELHRASGYIAMASG